MAAVRIAMFDLGRTLVAGDPAVMLARHLRDRGRFADGPWARLEEALVLYNSGQDMDRAVDLANEAFASGFAGLAPAALHAMATDALASDLRHGYYDYATALVGTLREEGYLTAGVTGVADPLAALIGADLGIERMFATALETRDGRLTGRTVFESRAGWKAERVRPLFEQTGASRPDSLAFGDSEADMSILAGVGRPFVMNPKPGFEARVRALGWPILRQGQPVTERVLALLQEPAWNVEGRFEAL